jgi:3-hydroxyisobutyrate dehydrogenase
MVIFSYCRNPQIKVLKPLYWEIFMQIEHAAKPRIGWIGTGVMGGAMARHLLDAGYDVSVYNRTPDKIQPLVDAGAHPKTSPASIAAESDIVFTIVGFPADVREVILGKHGVLTTFPPGGIVVDMTTSNPELAREINCEARRNQVDTLDAPVSGGDIGAREARLSIMVGGDPAPFARVEPLFRLMGKTIALLGPAGSGQHCKMVNQILIAGNMVGVVEGLLYARRAGLDPDAVIRMVGAGAAGSWSINNLGPRILAGNFEPGFRVDHFIKDLGIALTEARRMNLNLPGLSLAVQLYNTVQALGYGRKGTQALMLALDHLNANIPIA